jgi:large conductance mechanosensitive channel
MFREFKEFINRGGVFEAAVGLILALAFKPIVDSFVADIIMPIVARIFGTPDFSELQIGLGGQECTVDAATGLETCTEAAIRYGAWINTVVSFVIIGFVLFLMVKAYNRAHRPEPTEEVGPTEVELLSEIRDSLRK